MQGVDSLFILSCRVRAQSNRFLVVISGGLRICRFWFSGGSSDTLKQYSPTFVSGGSLFVFVFRGAQTNTFRLDSLGLANLRRSGFLGLK